MKFHIPGMAAAAITFTVLSMGVVGLLIILPIAGIQWMWNSCMTSFRVLPLINVWQAVLLYLAAVTALYLSGFVRVEFETEKLD